MTGYNKQIVIIAVLLSLTACTSSWKAPVSSYSTGYENKPAATLGVIKGRNYKVQAGDTLYSIAWRSGQDYKTLAGWNGLKSPFTIYTGQVLRLKAPVKKPVPAQNKTKTIAKTKPKPVSKTAKVAKKQRTTSSKTSGQKFKSSLKWQWPTKGKIIKSFKAGDDNRKGIVVSGNAGQPVKAAESGKVVYSGSGLIGYGQLIIIKHNDNYLSAYGYNRKLLVSEGDWITKGKQIATMGTFNQSVPSLHFEIRKNGNPLNPLRVLP